MIPATASVRSICIIITALISIFILHFVGLYAGENYPNSLKVTATAYNSLAYQTDGHPTIAAWGDKLKPGMKAIAVSRDLIPMGLTHGTKVKIDGIAGIYNVLDKINRRFSKRIDIYMGNDIKAAKEWGKREVIIRW